MNKDTSAQRSAQSNKLLKVWALQYGFDKLIAQARNKLKKPDFIINIEKLMKILGYQEFTQINYAELTVKNLLEINNFEDRDGYLKLAALYFVIDVVHLVFQYKNPKIEIIDNFCPIFNLTVSESQLVSIGWMLENGYPPKNFTGTLFNLQIPAYFRFYFLQQLLYTNDFTAAYKFFDKFNSRFPLNDQYPEEGKIIVQCLTAYGKLKEAHDFILQYCSPDQNEFKNFYQDYIIELYRVARITKKESLLNDVKFSQKEVNVILGYISCTESEQSIQFNAFFNMHQNNNI